MTISLKIPDLSRYFIHTELFVVTLDCFIVINHLPTAVKNGYSVYGPERVKISFNIIPSENMSAFCRSTIFSPRRNSGAVHKSSKTE